jgi:hypothetical protein
MKIFKKLFCLGATLVLVGTLQNQVFAASDFMTQGELARRIAFITGLAEGLQSPVTGESAADALTLQGWTPVDGWRVGALATKDDFYVVTAKYLGLKVTDPRDVKSYYDALARSGYNFAAGGNVRPVPKSLENRDQALSQVVLNVRGNAEFRMGNGPWQKLGRLQTISPGMSFRTGSDILPAIAKSYIDVVYARGSAQRIFENSEIKVEELKEDFSSNAVVVSLIKGETLSVVDPMAKDSRFIIRDPTGKFEVIQASGCRFTAKVVDTAAVAALNEIERKLTGGYSSLGEVQPSCEYVVASGGGSHFHSAHGSAPKILNAGQSISSNIQNVTLNAGVDAGAAINQIEREINGVSGQAGSPLVTGPMASDKAIITTSELVSFLQGVSGPGVSGLLISPIK